MIDPSEIEKMKIFLPTAFEELQEAMNSNQRFVYYTSAAVGLSVLKQREVWMRKVSCMNDYMEVAHGLNFIRRAWSSDTGKTLQKFLDYNFNGVVKEITDLFDGWQSDMQINTYITCVSRHFDKEDEIGRLSMWRAYGGDSGVAIVIKGTPFFRTDNTINVFSTPVSYLDEQGFMEAFTDVVSRITASLETLATLPREEIVSRTFNMLFFAAIATKHPGFAEEQEWRVVLAPSIWPSKFVKKSIEVVRGQPQVVYKLPFVNDPEMGVDWVDIDDVLDRVIIGPTENAHAVEEAFLTIMEEVGIADAASKVFVSDIPLR